MLRDRVAVVSRNAEARRSSLMCKVAMADGAEEKEMGREEAREEAGVGGGGGVGWASRERNLEAARAQPAGLAHDAIRPALPSIRASAPANPAQPSIGPCTPYRRGAQTALYISPPAMRFVPTR